MSADSQVEGWFIRAQGRAPVYTNTALSLGDLGPAALELQPPREEQLEEKEKLNVKIEPGGIKGPQRSKAEIIKKPDNGASVEGEVCESCVPLRLCDLFFTFVVAANPRGTD